MKSKAPRTVDPRGRAAQILGHLNGGNQSLWCVVADSSAIAGWRGGLDESDPTDDFERALALNQGPIAIGANRGVLVHIGYNHRSNLYRTDHGFVLVDCETPDDAVDTDRALAVRVAQWPVTTRPKTIGKVACTSGVLALVLPYRDGVFTSKELATARARVVSDRQGDRILVPMADGPGIYEIASYPFKPDRSRGPYTDEAGTYGNAYVVTYRDRLPKKLR